VRSIIASSIPFSLTETRAVGHGCHCGEHIDYLHQLWRRALPPILSFACHQCSTLQQPVCVAGDAFVRGPALYPLGQLGRSQGRFIHASSRDHVCGAPERQSRLSRSAHQQFKVPKLRGAGVVNPAEFLGLKCAHSEEVAAKIRRSGGHGSDWWMEIQVVVTLHHKVFQLRSRNCSHSRALFEALQLEHRYLEKLLFRVEQPVSLLLKLIAPPNRCCRLRE
jgi:hypothetical protein